MQINPKELVSSFMGQEMIQKKGIVLQYLNSNSSGATTMIGVTRIGLQDQRKMPAFVARNVSIIRQHAVAALQRHMRLTLCATGVLETLCPEDYSISFSWASLTEAGRSLTQHGKPDLALGYAMCEGLVAPIQLSAFDPSPVCILNVFIQLQDSVRRSNAVLKKAQEDEKFRASSPKKANVDRRNPQTASDKFAEKVVEKATVMMGEAIKRAAPAPDAHYYPPLPVGQFPVGHQEWRKDGITDIPDE